MVRRIFIILFNIGVAIYLLIIAFEPNVSEKEQYAYMACVLIPFFGIFSNGRAIYKLKKTSAQE